MKLLCMLPLFAVLACTNNKTTDASVTDTTLKDTTTIITPAAETTSSYAGVYEYGTDVEKEPVGQLTLYKEANDAYLFYLDVSNGAPSYHMGSVYGRLTVKDGKATYNNKLDYADKPCKLDFVFAGNSIKVTSGADIDCGFGNGVYADGDFKRTKAVAPDFFVNGEGTNIYFKKTTPEDYNK